MGNSQLKSEQLIDFKVNYTRLAFRVGTLSKSTTLPLKAFKKRPTVKLLSPHCYNI
jgi:hypothetical protein